MKKLLICGGITIAVIIGAFFGWKLMQKAEQEKIARQIVEKYGVESSPDYIETFDASFDFLKYLPTKVLKGLLDDPNYPISDAELNAALDKAKKELGLA